MNITRAKEALNAYKEPNIDTDREYDFEYLRIWALLNIAGSLEKLAVHIEGDKKQ